MNNTDKLKPCPCCKGKADYFGEGLMGSVACLDCELTVIVTSNDCYRSR